MIEEFMYQEAYFYMTLYTLLLGAFSLDVANKISKKVKNTRLEKPVICLNGTVIMAVLAYYGTSFIS